MVASAALQTAVNSYRDAGMREESHVALHVNLDKMLELERETFTA
jgi:hypothetical protein